MFTIIRILFFAYIAFRILGFVFRWAIRKFGYNLMQQQAAGANPFGQRPNNAQPNQQTPKKGNLTDKLGDYVEYEEVK
jgi:hypothetical protein